jgi:hypothetical protein
MRFRVLLPLLAVLFVPGCGSNSTAPNQNAARSYSGTASVGDFLSITLDPTAHTLAYTNLSNGDSGTIPYTANSDGTYALQDPNGVLVAAYELPNFGMLAQAAKAGPNHDSPALITAVDRINNISTSTFAGQGFNYMQFRTSDGGIEAGSVNIDSQGNATASSYWPAGMQTGPGTEFKQKSISASEFTVDPSGSFMTVTPPGDSGISYVFGTAYGVFAVDTPQGAMISLKKAASKDFDPANAGTYKAIYYHKSGATFNQGNETGTPDMANASIVIDANADVTVFDSQGNTMLTATLTPVADVSYLYGPNELSDPCYGLFTFRVITQTSQQDVFVAFMDHAILFGSFKGVLPPDISNPYEYLYGVGLK